MLAPRRSRCDLYALGKEMSAILRHNALMVGLDMSPAGYVEVEALLQVLDLRLEGSDVRLHLANAEEGSSTGNICVGRHSVSVSVCCL